MNALRAHFASSRRSRRLRATISRPRAQERSGLSKSDKRKQSLYFPEAMLDEIQKEAQRLQRSMSWVVQRAWKHARKEIKGIPGSNEPEE